MKSIPLLILSIITLFSFQGTLNAQNPNLGTTSSFALFTANGALTNVGASVVTGDIGTNVGAFSGFNTATVVGQTRLPGSTEAAQAAVDVVAAYNDAASAACTQSIGPLLGNGQILAAGVYCQSLPAAASSLTGILTLSGPGLFIVKLNDALTTATSSSIVLTNGASIDNVFFQVNGAVDVGVGSIFRGNILANGAIRLLTGSLLEGRALSIGGAITLSNSVVINPGVSLSATAGSCVPATNLYSVSGVVSLTNATAGVATLTDGSSVTTVSISAGSTSVPYSLSGILSGAGSHTVTLSYAGKITSATYTAPASCTVTSASLGGLVFTDSNGDGIQNGSDTPIPGVSVKLLDGTSSPIASATTSPSGTYSFTGLTSGIPYSVSFVTPAGFSTTNVSGIIGPVTLPSGPSTTTVSVGFTPISTPTSPAITAQTYVSLSKAKVGDVLTYSVVVTNTGSSTAATTVRDSISTGVTYIPGSATAPGGTSYTAGGPVSTWSIPFISPGQSLTLTFQVKVDSTGILYNFVSVPGDSDKICTSIPVKLCVGDEYTLTVPAGRSSYQWYKDGLLIAGQTTNVLVVTSPGSYSLSIDNAGGSCPDFSCCPFIVEQDTLPAYQAVTSAATCIGGIVQNNGQLVLTKFNPTHTYQYSLGSTFNPAASLSGVPKVIPTSGVISTTLAGSAVAQIYTVRVYNSSGCFTDVNVTLVPTLCTCPVDVCVPFVLTQSKRSIRIGDPR